MADAIEKIKIDIIRNQPAFLKLTEEETNVLASLLTEHHVKAGETIVKEGDPVDSVYLIVNGTADVRHVSIQDGQLVHTSLATLGSNEPIGLNETGFYSLSGVRTATVVALTDMDLFHLSVAAFHGFALNYAHVSEVMRKNAENIISKGESA